MAVHLTLMAVSPEPKAMPANLTEVAVEPLLAQARTSSHQFSGGRLLVVDVIQVRVALHENAGDTDILSAEMLPAE